MSAHTAVVVFTGPHTCWRYLQATPWGNHREPLNPPLLRT